jgi:threonine dehydrogenase-like Zn-dependent dehydrogenase
LERIGISGNDAVLVVGLGPVGLAALQLSKAMGARKLIGIDTQQARLDLASKLGLVDESFLAGSDNVKQVLAATSGKGCEKTVDCSGNHLGRKTCIDAATQVFIFIYAYLYVGFPIIKERYFMDSGGRFVLSARETRCSST